VQTVEVRANGDVIYISSGSNASGNNVTFANKKLNTIAILKLDAITLNPLANAMFTVEKANGERVGSYRTDASGKILISALSEGTYIISETAAPMGYILNETPKYVNVKDGKLVTVEFLNQPLSGIHILKTDAITHAPLQGAIFKIERDNGEKIGTYKTDIAGKILVSGLIGTFIVSEEIAPNGYNLDSIPQTVVVKSGKLATVEFINNLLATLTIRKLNSVTRQPIANVEFNVAKMTGEKVLTVLHSYNFKTDTSGQIYLTNLADGYYTVTEVKQVDGYLLDSEPKTVHIQSGKPALLEVLNTPQSSLLIVKTDEQTGKPLAGVVFDVKLVDGQLVAGNILDGNQPNTIANSPNKTTSPNGDISGSYTTDNNGRILINGLLAGEYHVVERKQLDGYELDTEVHSVTITPGKQATMQLTNTQKAGLRILKIDSISKKPIYGVEFMLFDSNNKQVGTYSTDNNGVIDFSGILSEGRYTIRETRAASGYYLVDVPKTVEFLRGKVTEIVWENTPQLGQIQITKKSADDNPINGFPAGTLLEGAVFEIYDKANNLVDTIKSNKNGLAVSKLLPLARYTVIEKTAPEFYSPAKDSIEAEIEFAGQIVRLTVLNSSIYTNVSVTKRGYTEVVPGQSIRYDFKNIANNSTVPLDSFFWRDTLPTDAVRLDKIITGTWSQKLSYKIVYKTNLSGGNYRTLADNLITGKTYTLNASAAALGLASNEFITEYMFSFGRVPAGFRQLEAPYIYCNVLSGLAHEYRFTNKTDVGGLWGTQWIMANDRWVTVVYNKATPPKLPRTGY
jgi:uncharacterized surface anchored protein